MSNVVSLHESRRIWVCNCGCTSFELMENGRAACQNCGETPSDGGLFEPPSTEEFDGPEPYKDIRGNGVIDLARQGAVKATQGENVAVILAITDEATVTLWHACENQKQAEWAKRQLEFASSFLTLGDDA